MGPSSPGEVLASAGGETVPVVSQKEKKGVYIEESDGKTKYYNPDGSPIWSPDRGFEGDPTIITLEPGSYDGCNDDIFVDINRT